MVTLLVFINIQEKMDAVIVATIQSQYEQTIFSIALSGTKHIANVVQQNPTA